MTALDWTSTYMGSFVKRSSNTYKRAYCNTFTSTPRDPREYSEEPVSLANNADFRYRGYPTKNFETPRENLVHASVKITPPPAKNYHLPNHFDTKRPKVFDDPKGFQYGSDEAPMSTTVPKPINNPIQSKTSAEWRKYRETQKEVDEEIQHYKQEKVRRMMDTDGQKKKDLEMLKQYHPWGKPGGGAPKVSHKMQGLQDESLHNSPRDPPTSRHRDLLEEYGDFNSHFGRPGAGAPLRTNSGKMITELKANADIRFQDSDKGKAVNEQEVRYRKPAQEKHQYAMELEAQMRTNQVENKAKRSQEERMSELRRELELTQHDPYGKPGAGAPNKTRSEPDHRPSRTHSEDFEFYDPWGKGANQPARDRYGNVQRHRNAEKHEVFTTERRPRTPPDNSLSLRGQGGGAPMKTESGQVVTRLPMTMRRNEKGDTVIRDNGVSPRQAYSTQDDPELQVYDPFGKGGAGAPIRDSNGNMLTSIYGKMQHEGSRDSAKKKQLAAKEYLMELEREIDEQRKTKDAMNSMGRAEAGELAGILKEGKVGKPRRDPNTGALTSQHLGTTDVTKERTDTRILKTVDSPMYHTELERAATERRRVHQLDRLKENQEVKHHQQSFGTLWGKPGGGAPNPTHGNKLANFDSILNTPRTKPDDYYNKTYQDGQSKPNNYVRSTVPSKANNLYEFNQPQKRNPKKEYNLLTPWASEQGEVF